MPFINSHAPWYFQFYTPTGASYSHDILTWLVVLTILQYIGQWEGWHPIYEMEKTCLKPPTSHHFPLTHDIPTRSHSPWATMGAERLRHHLPRQTPARLGLADWMSEEVSPFRDLNIFRDYEILDGLWNCFTTITNVSINGLVLLGKLKPESPLKFMEKSMVSGEDFPLTQSIDNRDFMGLWSVEWWSWWTSQESSKGGGPFTPVALPLQLDDGWPESVEEQSLLLLVWRHTFYTQALLHTDAFTHRRFYTQTLFTRRRFYTQKLLHTDAFTHRRFLHAGAFTHRSFYTQTLLHTDAFKHRRFLHTGSFTHRDFYTQRLLHTETFTHTDAFTHRRLYKNTFTRRDCYRQTLWHTDAFTHRGFYTDAFTHRDFYTHRRFYTQKLLHTDAFTHRHFYTQTLLHTDAFTHRRFYT